MPIVLFKDWDDLMESSSYFLKSKHFHYVLSMGAVFAMFAG
jgi:heme/copper-type cytochrome/quinol oxidase subunit 1